MHRRRPPTGVYYNDMIPWGLDARVSERYDSEGDIVELGAGETGESIRNSQTVRTHMKSGWRRGSSCEDPLRAMAKVRKGLKTRGLRRGYRRKECGRYRKTAG